jgi:hypothetical protein
MKDQNPASISTSGYTRPKITQEHLDSKPRTEQKKETKKENTTTKKMKTKLQTSSPTELQIFLVKPNRHK